MAAALIEEGARVLLTDIRCDLLEEAKRSIGGSDDHIAIVAADLAHGEDLERIVEAARIKFGRIDVLINNAGIGTSSIREDFAIKAVRSSEVTASNWHRFYTINSIAPSILSTMVIDGMVNQGWGRIINVTTSMDTMLRSVPYGPSKAGLEAYTALLAGELLGTGVTVNVLVPGAAVHTRMSGEVATRSGQGTDIMKPPVVWLVSSDADKVTGRRFLASKWDTSLDPVKAAELAGAPAAWLGYGTRAEVPKGWSRAGSFEALLDQVRLPISSL
jgi:3-oxoacyl-[acyl-carrier protein] reductase